MRSTPRAVLTASRSLLCVLLFSVFAVHAAEPTTASAAVDGDPSEWDAPFDSSSTDYFADMHRAGDIGKKVETRLFLRYDCASKVLYALVFQADDIPLLVEDQNAWIDIASLSGKQVSGTVGDDGVAPDFEWIDVGYDDDPQHARGFEASFAIGEGSYEFIAHVNVFDDGGSQTSATDRQTDKDGIDLTLACDDVSASPDLIAEKTSDAAGDEVQLGDSFHWTITVTNQGNADATFAAGDTVLADSLPSGPAYGTPTADTGGGVTGSLACTLSGETLTCTADGGALTIPPGESVSSAFTVTPSEAGTLTNPAGTCADAEGLVDEGDETNNGCASSVSVAAAAAELALGNLVFNDIDNDGRFEPDAGEAGIDGVPVRLHADDGDGVCEPAGDDSQVASATTAGGGLYLFDDLSAGDYCVSIPASAFTDPLAGRVSSRGDSGAFEPAPDPDGDVDNDDNGTERSNGAVASAVVSLTAESEPTGETPDNTTAGLDTNDNLTVDFGFTAVDLSLAKSLAAQQSQRVGVGDSIVFVLTVTNEGGASVTDVTLTDYVPAGLALDDPDWTANGDGTASVVLPGPLAPGESASVEVRFTVTPEAGTEIDNTAEIAEIRSDSGALVTDVDSDSDDVQDNDPPGEDDRGAAGVILEGDIVSGDPVSVPVSGNPALVVLMLVLGMAGAIAVRKQAR